MSNLNTTRTTEQAISDFVGIHGNRYDYSKFIYTKARAKGIIICKDHGEFNMTYDHHCRRKQNCPNCAHNKKQNTQECIELFIKKHGDRYDYSLVDYKGNRKTVDIICKKHGVFKQEPLSHKSGRDCPKCAVEESCLLWSELVAGCNEKHNNYYAYNEETYIKSELKMTITCPIHGDFRQVASAHKNGRGCRKCTQTGGWRRTPYLKRAIAYNNKSHLYVCLMSSGDEKFYKVGIAFNGTKERYRIKERKIYNIDLVCEYIGDADLVWDLETQILRSMMHFKHKPLKSFAGRTECLSSIDKSVYDCLDMFCAMGLLKKIK